MATLGIFTLKSPVNAATGTLRGRLGLVCVLMLISAVAAISLARIPVEQSHNVRGAVQWMSSPWAWWFGSPVLWWVAGFAAVGVIAACGAIIGRGGRGVWGVLFSSSISLIGIGVWYICGVALMSNRAFLRGPWYVTALAGGSLAAIVLLASVPTRRVLDRLNVVCAPGGVILSNRFVVGSAAVGMAMTMIVIAGVWLGLPSRAVVELGLYETLRHTQMSSAVGGSRLLLPTGGQEILRLDRVPTLGPPDARHVIYHFFDYTDPMSQACHVALREARKRYGSQIVVLTLVWPLDAAINPHVSPEVAAEHPGAGEYARIALAVWQADSSQFEAFHDYLLASHHSDKIGLMRSQISMPSLQEARATASAMVGSERLEHALADPLIDAQILLHIKSRSPQIGPNTRDNFAPLTNVLRYRESDAVYEGKGAIGPISSAWLFEVLEHFLGIEPLHTEVHQDDAIMQLLN